MPTWLSAAAISPYSPKRPIWFTSTNVTIDTFSTAAFSNAKRIANSADTCPNVQLPRTKAELAVSLTMSGFALGFSCPVSMLLTYRGRCWTP